MSETTAIDLTPFCLSPDRALAEHFPALTAPFVRGGWRCATDGVVCVRVPAPGEPDSPVESGPPWEWDRYPDAALLFSVPAVCGEPWPAGDVSLVSGVAECPECDGCGLTDDAADCAACGGKGRRDQFLYRLVGEHRIAAKYDRLIAALPGVRYAAGVPASGPRRRARRVDPSPLPFRFDGGGDGRVCGMWS